MSHETTLFEKIATWGVLAGVGGAVKYLSTLLRSTNPISKRSFLLRLFANIVISAFSGLLGALFVTTITTDHTWHILSAGVFGYMGTQGLDLMILAVKKKIEPSSKA